MTCEVGHLLLTYDACASEINTKMNHRCGPSTTGARSSSTGGRHCGRGRHRSAPHARTKQGFEDAPFSVIGLETASRPSCPLFRDGTSGCAVPSSDDLGAAPAGLQGRLGTLGADAPFTRHVDPSANGPLPRGHGSRSTNAHSLGTCSGAKRSRRFPAAATPAGFLTRSRAHCSAGTTAGHPYWGQPDGLPMISLPFMMPE